MEETEARAPLPGLLGDSSPAMRELKHFEKKLLKKVDFLQWKQERNVREIKILRRYLIQDREDYVK